MNNSIKVAGLLTACVFANSASALMLSDILPGATPDQPDNNAEVYTFTDSGPNTSSGYLFREIAGFKDTNKMGLYNTSSMEMLELFNGSASTGSNVLVSWDSVTGVAKNEVTALTANIGTNWGVYIDSRDTPSGNGGLFYSQISKNTVGNGDKVVSFTTNLPYVELANPYQQIFGFEDQDCDKVNCDRDFNDMVIGMTDVAAVPIPAAAWLFGSGLIGLAGIARRKKTA